MTLGLAQTKHAARRIACWLGVVLRRGVCRLSTPGLDFLDFCHGVWSVIRCMLCEQRCKELVFEDVVFLNQVDSLVVWPREASVFCAIEGGLGNMS